MSAYTGVLTILGLGLAFFLYLVFYVSVKVKLTVLLLLCLCAFCLERPSPKWPILCRVGR